MKAHLLDAETPLREGETLTALCQAEIPHAKFVFMWDTDVSHQFNECLNSLNTCRKCLDIEIEKRYVYGLIAAANFKETQ